MASPTSAATHSACVLPHRRAWTILTCQDWGDEWQSWRGRAHRQREMSSAGRAGLTRDGGRRRRGAASEAVRGAACCARDMPGEAHARWAGAARTVLREGELPMAAATVSCLPYFGRTAGDYRRRRGSGGGHARKASPSGRDHSDAMAAAAAAAAAVVGRAAARRAGGGDAVEAEAAQHLRDLHLHRELRRAR